MASRNDLVKAFLAFLDAWTKTRGRPREVKKKRNTNRLTGALYSSKRSPFRTIATQG